MIGVSQRQRLRLREAAHLGFRRAGVPHGQADEGAGSGLEVIPLATLRAAYETMLGERVEGGAEPTGSKPTGAAAVRG